MRLCRPRAIRRIAFLSLLVACGSRTGLFVEDTPTALPFDDAGPGSDASRDGSRDGSIPDALPPLDVQPPVDVNRTDCPDSDATLIYVVTDAYELYSFYPPDASFRFIGNLACPSPETPFSMAVDRKGKAFVVYRDGNLFNVSTLTAACVATTYVPGQAGFDTFGMGFATINGGPDEALFVAGDQGTNGLGRIDIPSLLLTKVGNFSPNINRAELTGTGDDRLFAFYTKPPTIGSFIGEIDQKTAKVVGETAFPTVDQGQGWAFAFWGGDFYMFHAPGGSSVVTRYRPADNSVTQIAQLPTVIVGAGVSTCAPQQ